MKPWWTTDLHLACNTDGRSISGKLVCKSNNAKQIGDVVKGAMAFPPEWIVKDTEEKVATPEGEVIITRTIIFNGKVNGI